MPEGAELGNIRACGLSSITLQSWKMLQSMGEAWKSSQDRPPHPAHRVWASQQGTPAPLGRGKRQLLGGGQQSHTHSLRPQPRRSWGPQDQRNEKPNPFTCFAFLPQDILTVVLAAGCSKATLAAFTTHALTIQV